MAGNIITDATDWTNVSDVFVPNDSNDWITIGNFYDAVSYTHLRAHET